MTTDPTPTDLATDSTTTAETATTDLATDSTTTAEPASDATGLDGALRALVDRAADAGHVHALLVGVETDDGTVSTQLSAGAASPRDPYFVASVTKMFTATIVMQLVDEGRLRLDDRVRGLLPELDLDGLHRRRGVDATDRLEVHHLLHQTSGLPDYFAGDVERDLRRGDDRAYSVQDVVDIARGKTAGFPPGDRDGRRSEYSDTNYQLLTAVVEAVTGRSYAELVDERIAAPLGLADTHVFGSRPDEAFGRPLPIRHRDRTLSIPLALASERGAGGVVSTVADQLRFSRAYHAGELFDPAHRDRMQRWNRVFFPIDYGYGVMRYRLPRWMTGFRPSPELVGHSGATGSFTFHSAEAGCHVVGTFNQFERPSRPFRLMSQIVDLVARSKEP